MDGQAIVCVRPTGAGDLLCAMARSGAFWNGNSSFYVGPDDFGLDHLLLNRFVTW